MNIELEYCYRDFGNNKRYNSVIFSNRSNTPLWKIEEGLLRHLGDRHTFSASQLELPEMFFRDCPYDPSLDWEMHEYCGAKETDVPTNDARGRDIREFLSQLREPVARSI